MITPTSFLSIVRREKEQRMPRLFAEFDVKLPGQCLYAFPDAAEVTYKLPVQEYEVEIILQMEKGSNNRGHGDTNWIGALRTLKVIASREESEFPPPVNPDSSGIRDYSIQFEYFWTRIGLYAAAAREITNRFIRYFQFTLGTPHLTEFKSGDQAFSNATWKNILGEEVGKGATIVVFTSVPGLSGALRSDCLSQENLDDLGKFLLNPQNFSVAEQLIDNARSAWFDGNLQRTVLELAIGCEVIVKRRFFSEDSPSGAAFDYLEDRAKVNIKVLELIDVVAHAAFAKSFKTSNLNDYRNIDYLFRCRNKIAHRGILSLRTDSAETIVPDKNMIADWFNSVIKLRAWLYA